VISVAEDRGRRLRVLLVDDHDVVLEGLRSLLEGVGRVDVVGQAYTASEAVAAARELAPDVVVLDNHLGGESGVAVCRRIKVENAAVRVIMLTAFADETAAAGALRAGASAFILKRSGSDSLIRAVKGTGSETLVDTELLSRLAADRDHDRCGLEGHELELARLVEAGLTNGQIAARLGIAEATVKSQVSRLLAHLGVSRRSEIARRLAEMDDEMARV
jgi:two-component system, NarL family, response regulator DevR